MGFFQIMSLVGSVAIILLVLLLTYYASRWYAKRMGASGAGQYIKVVDKTALGQNSSAVVVKAGGKYYLLGVADKSVNMLCELEDFEEPPAPEKTVISFSKVMRDALGKSPPDQTGRK